MTLAVRDLTTTAGRFTLGPLSFEIAAGECVALTGPVGAGKSTLVESLLGLRPVAGSLAFDGEELADAPVELRGFGWVPQDALLLPSQTVRRQVAAAAAMPNRSAPPRAERSLVGRLLRRPDPNAGPVEELLKTWGLGDLADRLPAALSGGQQQRVALVRAVASRPRLLLLDEAFSAQDADRRAGLRSQVREWARRQRVGVLHITHNEEEAAAVADRRLRIVDGQLVDAAS